MVPTFILQVLCRVSDPSCRWLGVLARFYCTHVVPDWMYACPRFSSALAHSVHFYPPDDAAAHISEETTSAARSAPIAIMTAVIFTEVFGWLFLISASYATTSVGDLLASDLPLPMGQLFLNALGKKGMLAIWCLLISIQVRRRFEIIVPG